MPLRATAVPTKYFIADNNLHKRESTDDRPYKTENVTGQ